MPNKQMRIKAFTLSEMLVVLIITTLVVGLAFSVLQLVQKQMYGMELQYEKNTELNKLKQALWLDLNATDQAFFDGTQNTLILSDPIEQKTYQFLEDKVIRHQDTFYLEAYSKEFYFENQEPSFGEIDAIRISCKSENVGWQLFVFKTNAATTYMNN